MALTGLQIFKLLPKTNCGECGVPDLHGFRHEAGGQECGPGGLCPYASEEAKKIIGAASKPPIRLVKIGPPEREVADRQRDGDVPPRKDLRASHGDGHRFSR